MSGEIEFLRAIYVAFNWREIETVLAALAPDVDWPNGMEGGRVHGRSAVRDYWTRQFALVNPHVEPTNFKIEEDGRFAVDVHQIVHDGSGKLLADQMVQHVYTIHDGMIVKMEIRNPES